MPSEASTAFSAPSARHRQGLLAKPFSPTLAVALALLLASLPVARAAPNFQSTFHRYNNDYGSAIAAATDGSLSYFAAGYSTSSSLGAGYWDIWVLKLGSTGTAVWSITLGASVRLFSRLPLGAAVSSEGSGCVVAAAQNHHKVYSRLFPYVVKMASGGTIVWAVFMGEVIDVALTSVLTASPGGYVVVGSYGFFGKVSDAGEIVWGRKLGPNAQAVLSSVVSLSDGSLLAAGHKILPQYPDGPGYLVCWTVKVTSAGRPLFHRLYGIDQQHVCNGIAVLSDDSVVLSGYVGTLNADLYAAKIDSYGTLQASKTYGGTYNEVGKSVLFESSSGTLYILGHSNSATSGAGYEINLWKIDSALSAFSSTHYVYSASNNNYAASMSWTPDGSIAMAGYATGTTTGNDFFLSVDSCRPGYLSNPSPPACSACPSYCTLCNSASACVRCNHGYLLSASKSSCGTTCATGTYVDSGQCKTCPTGCSVCSAASQCTSCSSGYYLASTAGGHVCVTDCPYGFNEWSGTCYCPNVCGGACTDCEEIGPWDDLYYVCVSCLPLYYIQSNNCYACPAGCQQCSSGGCQLCLADYVMYYDIGGAMICARSCPGDAYFTASATVLSSYTRSQCFSCMSNCDFCGSSTQCASCKAGYYLFDKSDGTQSCVSACGDGYYKDENNVCHSCLAHCKTCTIDSKCSVCNSGFHRKSRYDYELDSCVADCAPKYFAMDSSKCKECDFRCFVCAGPSNTECQSCDTSIPGVIEIANLGGGIMACNCAPGFVPDTAGRRCVRCVDPLCKSCNLADSRQCRSCFTEEYAMVYNAETLSCECPVGTYRSGRDKCLACSPLCTECDGPGNTHCLAGKCAPNTFPVAATPTTCIYMCDSDGLFMDPTGTKCVTLVCNSACLSCFGPASDNCIVCSDPTKLLLGGSCISACPPYYFARFGMCSPCGDNCESCSDSSTCTQCESPYFLQGARCVPKCSQGWHNLAGERLCRECLLPCVECQDQCRKCESGYYLYDGACWTKWAKPDGMYIFGGQFLPCSSACVTCVGPATSDCIECNTTAGYLMSYDGTCRLHWCSSGYYLPAETDLTSAECLPCHQSCATCTGGKTEDCLSCSPGYLPTSQSQSSVSTFYCNRCEQIRGLATDPVNSGQCIQICGDGIRLGEECDDGNTESGDGCSRDCKVETGFVCSATEGADRCYTAIPPEPRLGVLAGNSLVVIKFSRQIITTTNSTAGIISSIAFELLGASPDCELSVSPPLLSSNFSEIRFGLSVRCSLRYTQSRLKAKFASPSLFRDANGVAMVQTEATVALETQSWLSPSSANIVSILGETFRAVGAATLGLSFVGFAVFSRSAAMSPAWTLVHTLQILLYTERMSAAGPENLKRFLGDYLTVARLRLPIRVQFLEDLDAGVGFVRNFYQQLFAWAAMAAGYLLILALDRFAVPKRRFFGFVRRWKQDCVYNAVIRILLESYLDLAFCSVLNLRYSLLADYLSPALKVSTIAAVAGFLLACFFLSWCTRLATVPVRMYFTTLFKIRYSSLTDEFCLRRGPFVRGCYSVFLLRRLAFASVLTMVQSESTKLWTSVGIDVGYLLYLSVFHPYRLLLDNCANITGEVTILVTHCCLLFIRTGLSSGESATSYIGWTCIGLISVFTLCVWTHVVVSALRSALGTAKEKPWGASARARAGSRSVPIIVSSHSGKRSKGRTRSGRGSNRYHEAATAMEGELGQEDEARASKKRLYQIEEIKEEEGEEDEAGKAENEDDDGGEELVEVTI